MRARHAPFVGTTAVATMRRRLTQRCLARGWLAGQSHTTTDTRVRFCSKRSRANSTSQQGIHTSAHPHTHTHTFTHTHTIHTSVVVSKPPIKPIDRQHSQLTKQNPKTKRTTARTCLRTNTDGQQLRLAKEHTQMYSEQLQRRNKKQYAHQRTANKTKQSKTIQHHQSCTRPNTHRLLTVTWGIRGAW